MVLGSSGMAGHVVAEHLEETGFEVWRVAGTRRTTPDTTLLDATDQVALHGLLDRAADVDVIVNCVGVLIRDCAGNEARAAYLNAYLPHLLERRFAGTATRIVQLSTDCVFSGRTGPYVEESPYDGTLFYDRSKALGELFSDKDLTLRMSIIGPELGPGSGLFDWFMRQTGVVDGYANVIWNGITTVELARGVVAAIEQNLTGLYHLTPAETISKADLLSTIGSVFDHDVVVRRCPEPSSDKTLRNTRTDFDYQVPGYGEMILDLKVWMDAHPKLYAELYG
jgi:dTDP-4-dehydrorhamnose reductase